MFYESFMAVCKGVRDGKSNKRRSEEYHSISNHHMLYSSQHLDQMTEAARRKDEYECILNHMYNHDAMYVRDEEGDIVELIDSYKDVERKIIDRYWRV